MSERARLAMSDDEVRAFLDAGRRVQVATINPDGTPHLVPMSYALVDGRLALWTDPRSKKVANLRRDPRLSCLVEEGTRFADYRGVQLSGRAELLDDPETSLRMGLALYERYGGPLTDQLREAAASLAPERVMIAVVATRVVSWDHRKVADLRPSQVGR